MNTLTIVYNATSPVGARARAWLARQPALVPMRFVRAGTPGAVPLAGPEALAVVGDGRDVYRGAHAWLMCLWALEEFREEAMTLDPARAQSIVVRLSGPPVAAKPQGAWATAVFVFFLGLLGGAFAFLGVATPGDVRTGAAGFAAAAAWIWLTGLVGVPVCRGLRRQGFDPVVRVLLQISAAILAAVLAGGLTLMLAAALWLVLR